jgi:hypothetical protein
MNLTTRYIHTLGDVDMARGGSMNEKAKTNEARG